MNGLKQVVLAAVFICAAAVAWARMDEDAAAKMNAMGVPSNVVAVLAGSEGGAAAKAPEAARDGSGGFGGRGGPPESLVVTSIAGSDTVNDRITALGDGEAVRSVTIVPLASGMIDEVKISAGDMVEPGDVLAVLDSKAETIQRDRAELAVSVAQDKVDRYQRLVGSRAATEVQLTDAENELQSAKLELRDAELELERRSIVAPIAGFVGIVPVETGDYVTTQTEIATIDDRSRILVDFWLPERYAAIVETGGDVEATAIALPGETFDGTISAIGSRIDRDSRTLAVRAEVQNEGDRLRPGMSFRVLLRFPGETFTAIDPLALQWSSDGPYVWKIDEGKAMRVPVRIVQRNSDSILIDGELAAGEEVVIEGVQSVRPGGAVNVARTVDALQSSGS